MQTFKTNNLIKDQVQEKNPQEKLKTFDCQFEESKFHFNTSLKTYFSISIILQVDNMVNKLRRFGQMQFLCIYVHCTHHYFFVFFGDFFLFNVKTNYLINLYNIGISKKKKKIHQQNQISLSKLTVCSCNEIQPTFSIL